MERRADTNAAPERDIRFEQNRGIQYRGSLAAASMVPVMSIRVIRRCGMLLPARVTLRSSVTSSAVAREYFLKIVACSRPGRMGPKGPGCPHGLDQLKRPRRSGPPPGRAAGCAGGGARSCQC